MIKKTKAPADKKRKKISKAKQMTLLVAGTTAIIVGACGVLSINGIKYINFYQGVISTKDKSIANYEQVLVATGACPQNRDGFDEKTLKNCNPNDTESNLSTDTLKYNVFEILANNKNLESVETGNGNISVCYDHDTGQRIDYNKKYSQATDEKERTMYFNLFKACSALRIVPDALPAQANTEAIMASLNDIFNTSGLEPETLAPSDDLDEDMEENTRDNYPGIGIIPITFSIETNLNTTLNFLYNLERSIRVIDVKTASIEWAESNNIEIRTSSWAYYTDTSSLKEKTVTVTATDKGLPNLDEWEEETDEDENEDADE